MIEKIEFYEATGNISAGRLIEVDNLSKHFITKNKWVVHGKQFDEKDDAEKYLKELPLRQFVSACDGGKTYVDLEEKYGYSARGGGRSVLRMGSIPVRKLATNGIYSIGYLKTYLMGVLSEEVRQKVWDGDGLLTLNIERFDDAVNPEQMMEITAELVWQICLGGQKSMSANKLMMRVEKNPELFWTAARDLTRIYAWKRLSGSEE
jgi:hypothetical protein